MHPTCDSGLNEASDGGVPVHDIATRIARCCHCPVDRAARLARELLSIDVSAADGAAIKRRLLGDGLATSWNDALDRQRASFLARRIDELVDPCASMVDVLSGTGTLSAAIRERGHLVIEVERPRHYPARRFGNFVSDIDAVAPTELTAEVGLSVASLHHEESLDRFMGWLSQVSVERWIVIENLRDEETNADLHRRFDWFFNRCLNDFGAECPGWYWTSEQWLDVLSTLGEARWISRTAEVPGIPFAYDFFEVIR